MTPYVQIPVTVMRAAALTLADKFVLGVLLNFRRIGGKVVPKVKTICAETGICRTTVFHSLAHLQTLGLITWTRGKSFNTYIIQRDFHRLLSEVRKTDFRRSGKRTSDPPYLLIEKNNRKES